MEEKTELSKADTPSGGKAKTNKQTNKKKKQ